ncbi:hypothetical protein niasHS_014965 [Heterodera schachtii]|uniref:G protein-coupled receptor n=1 Tax=Heterodera schachtii TaxID=97005 RepID=A0ABD2ICP6_HETSC
MIGQIHRWNAFVCLLLGFCFNSVLIWLLLFRSTKEMRSYSRILLQTAVVDLLLSLANALVQPVPFEFVSLFLFPLIRCFSIFFIHENAGIFYLNGPWMPLISSASVRFLLLVLWILLIDFSVHGLCVQFYVRYLQIVREIKISLLRYAFLLLLLLLFDLVLCVLFFHAASKSQSDVIYNEQIAQLLSVPTSPAIFVTVNAVSSDTGHVTSLYGLLLGAFCYSVIFVSAHRTMKTVKANALSGKTWGQQQIVDMNKQITRSLIVMATMPLALNFVHIAFAVSAVVYSKSGDEGGAPLAMLYVEMLALLPSYWLPVLNPLGTVFTVKPFWRAVTAPLVKRVTPCLAPNTNNS